ncbi:transposase IS3/IS911 family protein [Aeromonas diversa CDC 2478-85]|uniref:Transposase IS3/IS911 family protein n=1 Tax=Aeromonas diversa CDC 2478-85 TaxID=1268237 RepID=N9U2Y2_9GAMM|nr:transposase IS3/IS911 family protein [Aeromonas diversa CDC 2478-85]
MKSREHYSPEFRAEAVRLVLEQGLSQAEAARRLGIAKGTLANWVVAAKGGQEKPAPGGRSVAELEAEVARLRKALAQANMERDIIKKAAAYFAQESLPSTRG